VGFDGKIPESTYKAIDLARKNGHQVFLCTGRSVCQIYKFLLDFGFDGIIAATGAYVEYEGRVIRHETIGAERIAALLGYFEQENIAYALQAADCQVASPKSLEIMMWHFNEMRKKVKLNDEPNVFEDMILAEDLRTNPEHYAYAEKLIYYCSPRNLSEVRQAVAPHFEVTPSSFEKPDETCGEVTMTGVNKASGMRVLGDYLNCTSEDMIAFGDGANDIDMLEYAGIGVAMGNASDIAKASADMVTERIDADGIFVALKKIGLI
jgi:Cof subfamily protein (haloacid dehalogenase superfamily)